MGEGGSRTGTGLPLVPCVRALLADGGGAAGGAPPRWRAAPSRRSVVPALAGGAPVPLGANDKALVFGPSCVLSLGAACRWLSRWGRRDPRVAAAADELLCMGGGGGPGRSCAPSGRAAARSFLPRACPSRGAPPAEPRSGGGGHRGHPTCGGRRRGHRRRHRRHGRCRHRRSRRGAVGGNAPGPPTACSHRRRHRRKRGPLPHAKAKSRSRDGVAPTPDGGRSAGSASAAGEPGKATCGEAFSHRVPWRHAKWAIVNVLPCSLACASAPRSPRTAGPPLHRTSPSSVPSAPPAEPHRRPSPRPPSASTPVHVRSSTAASSLAPPPPPFGRARVGPATRKPTAGRSAVPPLGGTARDAAAGTPTAARRAPVTGGSDARQRSGRRGA